MMGIVLIIRKKNIFMWFETNHYPEEEVSYTTLYSHLELPPDQW